ncbi:MAG: hypothetical protein LBJ61_10370, partial [Deltaproteobacteria bacterium]|nr:hypothetical protein [Deltaproteobacteria bacterium]
MDFFSANPYLSLPLNNLPGIGKTKAEALSEKGLTTIGHLLSRPPSFYQDRRAIISLAEAQDGQANLFLARLKRTSLDPKGRYLRGDMVDDLGHEATIWWFGGVQYWSETLKAGELYLFAGKVTVKDGRLSLSHPDIWPAPNGPALDERDSRLGIIPIYGLLKGLTPQSHRNHIESILNRVADSEPLFPEDIIKSHGFSQPLVHLATVHRPPAKAKGKLPKPKESRAWQKLAALELALWRLILLSAKPKPAGGDQGGQSPDPSALAATDKL